MALTALRMLWFAQMMVLTRGFENGRWARNNLVGTIMTRYGFAHSFIKASMSVESVFAVAQNGIGTGIVVGFRPSQRLVSPHPR